MTAKEIAKKLNISSAAVSMALNNKPGVSTTTRKRVFETAKEMKYDFSRLNKTDTTNNKGHISLIIYKKHGAVVSDTPFFNILTESIDYTCSKLNYQLHISYYYQNHFNDSEITDIPLYDGIILLATEMNENDFMPFKKVNVPIVILDTYFHSLDFDCVLINNFKGAFQATNYLIEQCKSQPGYLHSSYEIGNFNERADGFYKAIRSCGMSPAHSRVYKLTPSLEGSYNDMLEIIEEEKNLPKCFFADNDLIAAGVIKALQEKGYQIPKDISIIGFDNTPYCTYLNPKLTTVMVPNQYMGQLAVERLINIINSSDYHTVKIEVDTTIIVRESVCKSK